LLQERIIRKQTRRANSRPRRNERPEFVTLTPIAFVYRNQIECEFARSCRLASGACALGRKLT
jgi:hypothetical protein